MLNIKTSFVNHWASKFAKFVEHRIALQSFNSLGFLDQILLRMVENLPPPPPLPETYALKSQFLVGNCSQFLFVN